MNELRSGGPRAPRHFFFPALFLTLLGLAIGAASAIAADNSASNMPAKKGIDAILGAKKASSSEPDFLPVDQAFQVEATADGPDKVRIEWVIHEGYYLYKSRLKFVSPSPEAKLGEASLPKGKNKHDEYFGDQEVYHDELVATIPVAHAGVKTLQLPLEVSYQGCAEAGLCYPPQTKSFTVALGQPAAAATNSGGDDAGSAGSASGGRYVSKQDALADLIRHGNLIAVLGAFFGIGLLLSMTPCVLPMIPILSGLIIGQGSQLTPMKGFSLAFTYVQGMALTYAAAGAIFVIAFGQAPQGFFNQPWIIGLFCALFVLLAFAMFGTFTLQLPSALQTRLTNASNKQKSGSYVGVFVMGALSALVVTACVAPAIVGALSVIGQSGLVGRGAGALYATGLGMGAPLLVVGASAGSLLPRVGPWMDTVKAFFGVIFLGVALYFGQQLIPDAAAMLLWSALAVIGGFWMFSWKARDGSPAPAAVRAPGLLAVVYGIILLIGMAAGGTDPLQPLGELRMASSVASSPGSPQSPGGSEQESGANGATAANGTTVNGAAANSTEAVNVAGLSFEPIWSVKELTEKVAAARAAGKPVLVDFYATWCTSCKEMERYTFTDSQVQAALSNAVLLRADVTRNGADAQALYQHFGIYGPPTIAFYDPQGQEQRNFRVVGYMKAPEFASVLRQAFTGNKPI